MLLGKMFGYVNQKGWERSDSNSFLGINFDLLLSKRWAKVPWHLGFKHIPVLNKDTVCEWDDIFTQISNDLKKIWVGAKPFIIVFLVDEIPDDVRKYLTKEGDGLFDETPIMRMNQIIPLIIDKGDNILFGKIPKIPIPAKRFTIELIDIFERQMGLSHNSIDLRDKKSAGELKKDLREWGLGLIVLGIIQLSVDILNGTWGIFLIAIGIFNFILPKKFLFILNGIAIIFAGFLNLYALSDVPLTGSGKYLGLFALFQLYLGVRECLKFSHYK